MEAGPSHAAAGGSPVSSAPGGSDDGSRAAAGGPQPAAAAGAPGGGRAQKYDDQFMMFVFKVEMCKRVDKHDREQCPYAHPGELARRRHPSLYQALPCPEARAKKICPRLERCNCSHSTFEFWLHPDRFKTFLCERGDGCDRPVCFFAHTESELRELPAGLQRTLPAARPAGAQHEQQHYAAAARDDAGSSSSGAQAPLQAGAQPAWARQGEQPGAGGLVQGRQQQQSARQLGRAAGGAGAASQQHGRTVAVIPAGPSAWQGNSLIESEPGEAPSLEAICAALARGSLLLQQQQQQHLLLQQHQSPMAHLVQPAMLVQQPGVPITVPGPYPSLQLLPPQQDQPQPQQYVGQHPSAMMLAAAAASPGQQQQQGVLLPRGQAVYMQMLSPGTQGGSGQPGTSAGLPPHNMQ